MMKEQEYLKNKYKKMGYDKRPCFIQGIYFDEDKEIFVRLNTRKLPKLFKKNSNKKIRNKGEVPNGNKYKRMTMGWKQWV